MRLPQPITDGASRRSRGCARKPPRDSLRSRSRVIDYHVPTGDESMSVWSVNRICVECFICGNVRTEITVPPSVRRVTARYSPPGENFIDLPDNLPAELTKAMQRTQPLEFDARAPLRCPS